MMRSTFAAQMAVAAIAALFMTAPAGTSAGGPRRESETGQHLAASMSECVFCLAYARYAEVLHLATREVAALANGVVIHLRCEQPERVLLIQQYTFEKQRLRAEYWAHKKEAKVCAACGELLDRLAGARCEVANSVHGVFTVITSDNPQTVQALHELAAQEAKEKEIRGSQ